MDKVADPQRSSDLSRNSGSLTIRAGIIPCMAYVGNMVLVDGSAQQFTRAALVNQMMNADGDPNCSLKPN
jgi:hypothetical protein